MIAVIPERNDETFMLPEGNPPLRVNHPVHGELQYLGISEGKAFYKAVNLLESLALHPVDVVHLPQAADMVDAMLEAGITYHQELVDALKKAREKNAKR